MLVVELKGSLLLSHPKSVVGLDDSLGHLSSTWCLRDPLIYDTSVSINDSTIPTTESKRAGISLMAIKHLGPYVTHRP